MAHNTEWCSIQALCLVLLNQYISQHCKEREEEKMKEKENERVSLLAVTPEWKDSGAAVLWSQNCRWISSLWRLTMEGEKILGWFIVCAWRWNLITNFMKCLPVSIRTGKFGEGMVETRREGKGKWQIQDEVWTLHWQIPYRCLVSKNRLLLAYT